MGWMMDGLESDAYDRTYGDSALVRRVLTYFKPHWKPMLLVILVIVGDSAVSAGVPILVSRGIDLVAGKASAATITWLVVAVLIFSALAWLFNYVRWSVSARVVGDVVLKLRQDAFAAVTQRDLSFYDAEPSGKIVSRVTSDTQDFSEVVMLVLNLVSQLLMVFVLFGVLMSINFRMTLILLALIPVVIALALSFRKIARTVTQKARRVLAKVNALIQESVSGIAVAKNFRQEAAVYKDFLGLNQQAYGVNLIRGWVLNMIIPLLEDVAGFDNAEEIFSQLKPGLDAIGTGMGDLSYSLARPGQKADRQHPLVKEAAAKVVSLSQKTGIPVMDMAFSPDHARETVKNGTRILLYSIDQMLFYSLCQDIISNLKLS